MLDEKAMMGSLSMTSLMPVMMMTIMVVKTRLLTKLRVGMIMMLLVTVDKVG